VQSIDIAPSVLLGPNPQRCAILFSQPATGSYTINTRNPQSDSDGIVIAAGAGSLLLSQEEHGSIVQQSWYAKGASLMNVTYIETMGGEPCSR
jgi:hypothetical protein